MNAPVNEQFLLDVATPTLGTRITVENDVVCLTIGNEGGRGIPSHLVLLPVMDVGATGMELRIDWNILIPGPADRLGSWSRYCHPLKDVKPPGPFTIRFSRAEWSKIDPGNGSILVVLLFDLQDRLKIPAGRKPVDPITSRAWKFVLNKLMAILSEDDKSSWRRRGVVRLDATDFRDQPSRSRDGRVGSIDQDTNATSFLLASCQYPAGLNDGTPQDFPAAPPGPADASMLRMAALLEARIGARRPSLLLLTGDQIYADATAGLFDARAGARPVAGSKPRVDEDWLRIPYQNWLGSVGAQSVLGLIPTRMMLDDHEIDDNWESADPEVDPQNGALLKAGVNAYGRYQLDGPRDLRQNLWRSPDHRGVRLFLANTRTEREARRASSVPLEPRIMSSEQFGQLLDWLRVGRERPAFVVSPSIFLPRRRTSTRGDRAALHSDAWDGYPGSLHAMLAFLWRENRSDVVFLSGDEHLSCVAQATVSAEGSCRSVTLHSIHSSGLYAPYPFANAVPEEFAAPDRWRFEDPLNAGAWFTCEVKVLEWIPGDGFACLSLDQRKPSVWNLNVTFDRAGGAYRSVPMTLRSS